MNDDARQDLENRSELFGMYAFKDLKSQRYDTPFFCQSDLFAWRHYKIVSDGDNMVNKFKADFNLDRLGYFNQDTGEFLPHVETLIVGKTVVSDDAKRELERR
jgi:hypothetical protein